MQVTADDIAQLLASRPPRKVPAHVVAAARKGRAQWTTGLVGLVFALFGLVFVAVFFPWRALDEMQLATGDTRTVAGVVSGAKDTNMKVNGRLVREYRFTFTPPEGTPRTGVCFAHGAGWEENESVTVRYLAGNSDVACIDGARLDEAGLAAGLVVIFPLLGAGMLAWFVNQRRQIGRLLHEGVIAELDVLSVEATNMQVNKRPVYKITLSSPGVGRQPVAVRRVNPADLTLVNRHREQKQPVFVLYDPRKPSRLIFPEALLGS